MDNKIFKEMLKTHCELIMGSKNKTEIIGDVICLLEILKYDIREDLIKGYIENLNK